MDRRQSFLACLAQLEQWLASQQIPYAVFGSVAAAAWTDSFDETVIWGLAAKWMAILPCPFTAEDAAAAHALFLTRLHDRFLRTGLAHLAGPATSDRGLSAVARAYTSAIDDLARQAGLAA